MNAVAPDPRRWKALILICTAIFVVVLDIAIVNVALPSIGADLHFAERNLQWVITAYGLTYGGFLLLGGRASDLIGRRIMFMIGLALFGDADHRTRRPGARRGDRDPGGALDHLGHLHRGQ